MSRLHNQKKVFGLTEVVIGLFILATVFGGLLASFIGVRRYISHATRRIDALNLARFYLNSWSNYVREDTIHNSSNPLYPGTDKSLNPAPPSPYSGKYSVVDHGDYLEVSLIVYYPYD